MRQKKVHKKSRTVYHTRKSLPTTEKTVFVNRRSYLDRLILGPTIWLLRAVFSRSDSDPEKQMNPIRPVDAWIGLSGLTLCLFSSLATAQGLSGVPQRLDETRAQAGSAISFANDVAPILMQHCGACHVRQSKGGFSMASFASLSSADGVLSAGNPQGSSLITMIESREMPPRGRVPASQLTTLKRWVQSGAAFDGNDRNANLASLRGGSNRAGNRRGPAGGPQGEAAGYGADYPGASGYEEGYGEEMETGEEDLYGADYPGAGGYEEEGGPGPGSPRGPRPRPGGPRPRGPGMGGPGENAMLASLPADSQAGLEALTAFFSAEPEGGEMDFGPVLQLESEKAFKAGDYLLARQLAFAHMAAEYPDSVASLEGVKYSSALRRPVWNVRFGVSLSVRGSSEDPQPIRVTTTGRRSAQEMRGSRSRGARGRQQNPGEQYPEEGYGEGYGEEEGMMEEQMEPDMSDYGDPSGGMGRPQNRARNETQPQRQMLDPAVQEELDRYLGVVAEVIGDGFKKRFQAGDFGPVFSTITPPEPVDDRSRNRIGGAPVVAPSMSSSMPEGLAIAMGAAPEPTPMWLPGIIYLGKGSSEEIIPQAQEKELDLLLHFDVSLKPGRNDALQNISRCRLIIVKTGKTAGVTRPFDSREAATLADLGRSGEREYVEDQTVNFFAVLDRDVKCKEFPRLSASSAKSRVVSLMSGRNSRSLQTLAEIQLYRAQGLITDEEVEIAFDIVGGTDGMVLLHGPREDRLAVARKWAVHAVGGSLDDEE